MRNLSLTHPSERASALLAATILHLLAVALLLIWRHALPVQAASDSMSMFDVTIPPLTPPPPSPPPILKPRVRSPAPTPGGSRKTAARVVTDVAVIAEPQAPNLTPLVDALPPLPIDGSSSGANLAGPVASGDGQGSGSGRGDGAGPGSGTPEVRYDRAEWIHYPTLPEINPYWPTTARRLRISGRVILGCKLKRAGKLDRCWLLSEQPRGHGFGQAALRMSRIFRIRPITRNGETYDLPVQVPITFRMTPPPPPRKPAPTSPTPP